MSDTSNAERVGTHVSNRTERKARTWTTACIALAAASTTALIWGLQEVIAGLDPANPTTVVVRIVQALVPVIPWAVVAVQLKADRTAHTHVNNSTAASSKEEETHE